MLGYELDLALPEARVPPVHVAGHRGANVIVGLFDSGIDYRCRRLSP